MSFYPRTLKSQWYMANVCDSIFAALEGMKSWTASHYDNEAERSAYLETFEQCQRIVKYCDLHPNHALQALSDLHTQITTQKEVYPFFSLARWVYDPNNAREQAVKIAFQIVDSVSNRFLC